jgi:type I restriction enzyme, S subunit
MADGMNSRGVLPPGWVWAQLRDLGKWGSGGTPSRRNPSNYGGNIPWIKIGDLTDGPVNTVEETISEDGFANSATTLLAPETLLIAMYGASIGKIGITTSLCTTNQAIAHCFPFAGIDLPYLFYVLQSMRQRLIKLGQGGAQPNISQGILKGLSIPLAPSEEQHRIAAKAEELFGEIEAGEQELEKAREGLEAYRRAVLKAAVTGELTREWREKNAPNETGADLLNRALAERSGQRASRTRRAPPKPDDSILPDLPFGWVWASLGDICDIVGGITVDAKRSTDEMEEVPYLRVANVQRGFLNLRKVKTIRVPPEQVARLRLKSNDVLLNEGGDKDKVGRGWVWNDEVADCIHQNHVFRARPLVPELDGRFISTYANEVGRKFFFDGAKQTTNLASLSMSKVAALPVPLPPAAELARIVELIVLICAELETEKALIKEWERAVISLRQSILATAFSGKLVPQDLADEPASALLERLRAQKAAAPAPRHSRRTVDASRDRSIRRRTNRSMSAD